MCEYIDAPPSQTSIAVRHGPYTKKIDLWAYGYAIAEILGYTVRITLEQTDYKNNPPITCNRHLAIVQMLHAHGSASSEDKPLVDLALKLLVWKPEERWSAAQALRHTCWDPIAREQVEEADRRSEEDIADGSPPRAKRAQRNDPSSKPDR